MHVTMLDREECCVVVGTMWRVLPGCSSRLSDKACDAFDNELRRLWLSRPLSPVQCSEKYQEDA